MYQGFNLITVNKPSNLAEWFHELLAQPRARSCNPFAVLLRAISQVTHCYSIRRLQRSRQSLQNNLGLLPQRWLFPSLHQPTLVPDCTVVLGAAPSALCSAGASKALASVCGSPFQPMPRCPAAVNGLHEAAERTDGTPEKRVKQRLLDTLLKEVLSLLRKCEKVPTLSLRFFCL